MGTSRGGRGFVDRLEDRIGALMAGRDRVALAFSGGLASTLVAMVARKRCDLTCVVAGGKGSPDVDAARAAKAHFDYRVEYVYLDGPAVHQIVARLRDANRGLTVADIRSLVPVRAVLERRADTLLVTGFGSPRTPSSIQAVLRQWGVQVPLIEMTRGRLLPRTELRTAAVSLGLPIEWARVPHRSPANGAGIADLLERPLRSRR